PLLSPSFRELWRRWHITLSHWLRDYVYRPLGGARGGTWRTARNLMITMTLGGLWHGAAWHLDAWGAAAGVVLVVERLWVRDERRAPWRVWLTFQLFCATVLLFRAPSLRAAATMLAQVAHLPSSGWLRASAALIAAPALLLLYARASRLRALADETAPRS